MSYCKLDQAGDDFPRRNPARPCPEIASWWHVRHDTGQRRTSRRKHTGASEGQCSTRDFDINDCSGVVMAVIDGKVGAAFAIRRAETDVK